jgi:hypothetical protein
MSYTQAKTIIKSLGFTFKKTDYNEYRINIKGGSEDTAYYTNDLQDAIDTASNWK